MKEDFSSKLARTIGWRPNGRFLRVGTFAAPALSRTGLSDGEKKAVADQGVEAISLVLDKLEGFGRLQKLMEPKKVMERGTSGLEDFLAHRFRYPEMRDLRAGSVRQNLNDALDVAAKSPFCDPARLLQKIAVELRKKPIDSDFSKNPEFLLAVLWARMLCVCTDSVITAFLANLTGLDLEMTAVRKMRQRLGLRQPRLIYRQFKEAAKEAGKYLHFQKRGGLS